MANVQSDPGANQGTSWEKHSGMVVEELVVGGNQPYCTKEIKVLEKAPLSNDWNKSSSSRHSEPELNSPQPLLKERLISCSKACCTTNQAGMQ